jgi:hypothetical protein
MTVHHDHAVDSVGAVLLIADFAVLLGVVLLLWLRPGHQRNVPPGPPLSDVHTAGTETSQKETLQGKTPQK